MAYSHGIKWTNEMVAEEIIGVEKSLGLGRMPTSTEIQAVRGGHDLHNVICRRGGYNYWANEVKLPMTKCETRFGQKYECIAEDMLKGKAYDVKKMTTKAAYDLLVNEKVRIDVKAANPYFMRGTRVHVFNLAKRNATCDIYMAFAIDEHDNVEKLLIIPWGDIRDIITLGIGANSVYDKYIGRFDFIERYTEFYSKLGEQA